MTSFRKLVPLIIALAAAGCAQPARISTAPILVTATTPPPATGAIKSIEVSTGDVQAVASNRFEPSALLSGTVNVRVTTNDGEPAKVGDVDAPSGQWVALKLPALDKATSVPVAVGPDTFQLATLPADFPDYQVTATHPRPGVICMTPFTLDNSGPSYLLVTDELGHPRYYRKLPDQGYNLQKHTAPDGSTRYSYLQREGAQIPNVQAPLGAVHLLDGDFKELSSFKLLPYGNHGELTADIHEFVYLADDHYILISARPELVTNVPAQAGASANVVAAVIQEVQGGKVVMEWDSTQHPEFYSNASDGHDYATSPNADYMHLNSVQVDPKDGNLIVSFRHQDQVVKLERQTGRILWRLGGGTSDFPLTPDQRFSHQHYVHVEADGSLTMFDNGNGNTPQQTRLLTFQLDEANHAVKGFKSLAPETRYSAAMGNFQLLDADTAFAGWGAKGTATTDATEYGPDGQPTFSLAFGPKYVSYRALKYLD